VSYRSRLLPCAVATEDVGDISEAGVSKHTGSNGGSVPASAVDDRRCSYIELVESLRELSDRDRDRHRDRAVFDFARLADVNDLKALDVAAGPIKVGGGQPGSSLDATGVIGHDHRRELQVANDSVELFGVAAVDNDRSIGDEAVEGVARSSVLGDAVSSSSGRS
jgi:hypothetical protein